MNYSFKSEFTKRYGHEYQRAAKELGKSERTLRRYVSRDICDDTVRILLDRLSNKWIHPHWQDCYWNPDGTITTPYGLTRPSDVMLVHRYKWHSHNASNVIQKFKEEQMQSEAYMEELQDKLLDTLGYLASRKL